MTTNDDLRILVANLYRARQAKQTAKKARAAHAATVGSCEYYNPDAYGSEQGTPCYLTYRNPPCATCTAKRPLQDDYTRKVNEAAAALRAVLRAGKRLSSQEEPA